MTPTLRSVVHSIQKLRPTIYFWKFALVYPLDIKKVQANGHFSTLGSSWLFGPLDPSVSQACFTSGPSAKQKLCLQRDLALQRGQKRRSDVLSLRFDIYASRDAVYVFFFFRYSCQSRSHGRKSDN